MVTHSLSRSGVMYSPMKAARHENSMRSNLIAVALHVLFRKTTAPQLPAISRGVRFRDNQIGGTNTQYSPRQMAAICLLAGMLVTITGAPAVVVGGTW